MNKRDIERTIRKKIKSIDASGKIYLNFDNYLSEKLYILEKGEIKTLYFKEGEKGTKIGYEKSEFDDINIHNDLTSKNATINSDLITNNATINNTLTVSQKQQDRCPFQTPCYFIYSYNDNFSSTSNTYCYISNSNSSRGFASIRNGLLKAMSVRTYCNTYDDDDILHAKIYVDGTYTLKQADISITGTGFFQTIKDDINYDIFAGNCIAVRIALEHATATIAGTVIILEILY